MTKSASSLRPQSDALFDELLVMMAQSGDKSAFERLHLRWHHRLAIWKGMSRLRDPKRFRSYIFGMLHRRGADLFACALPIMAGCR